MTRGGRLRGLALALGWSLLVAGAGCFTIEGECEQGQLCRCLGAELSEG